MQRFLENREVVSHSLVSEEIPDPSYFLHCEDKKLYSTLKKCYRLPNKRKHGKCFRSCHIYEENSEYKLGLLHGEYSIKMAQNPPCYASFVEGKPLKVVMGTSTLEFNEDGQIVRHVCKESCAFYCYPSPRYNEIKWEKTGNDVIISQRKVYSDAWENVVRYTNVLPYSKENDASSVTCNVIGLVRRVLRPKPILSTAENCVVEKGHLHRVKTQPGKRVFVPWICY
ncbi:hypothetical protein [Brazilian marseillevirus]|uniref:hypothetical protein n=1 Tax=Brazilian marseillevirus TaxID=1813599 RepID=UPI0007826D9F|nr:hypothetical protein A3303_gp294 [Brazilian marseillevirus]AMQ10802.1 hypothetical protein [Brazilian marseillevirus]